MASNFSARFYRSSTPRNENMPNGQITPQREGVLAGRDASRTTPVSTASLYRAIEHLSREVKEGNKRQTEEMRAMETKVSELTDEVMHLRQKLEEVIRDDEVVQPAGKRPRKANSTRLSELVRRLHNSDENERKYEGKEGLNSSNNAAVTTFLVKEIGSSSEQPPHIIRAACVGYYETIRRKHVLKKPENKEKAAKETQEKKLRSRRKRLLDARCAVLRTEEERTLWNGVTPDLMSDEEDTESNGVAAWLVKPPAFRSLQLTALCGELQARLEADPKYKAAKRNPRVTAEGTQSNRPAPRTYDPNRAPSHLTPSCIPRPASRPSLSTITNRAHTASSRRPAGVGRSLSFQGHDHHDLSRSLEGYNEPSLVDDMAMDSFEEAGSPTLTPL